MFREPGVPEDAKGEGRVVQGAASVVGKSKVEATATVGVSVELLWNVLETAKGNKEPNPDELREIEEVIGARSDS